MIEKVTKFTRGAEEITDELTHSAGIIITKATPLLAPMASGLTVLFAVYDGAGKMLTGKVDHAYGVSFVVGLFLMLTVEGINFASTFNRDRSEALKKNNPGALEFVNMDSLVSACFWLTVAVIFMLESLPGIVAWYSNDVAVSDMVFRVGLLILPFFSKAGARIFSIATILDGLEGIQENRRMKRDQEKRQEAELAIELDTKRRKADLELRQQEAEHKQRMEIERLKAESKIIPKSTLQSVKPSEPESVQSGVLNTALVSTEQRLNNLIDTLLNTGWQGVSALARALRVSRTTIYADLDTLSVRGLLRIIRDGDEKITDVQVVQISMEIPRPVIHLNGNSH